MNPNNKRVVVSESVIAEEIMPERHDDGHLYVKLEADDGSIHEYKVEYLVWSTFRGPIPEGHYVGHIDGNVENNYLENLRLLKR